MRRRWKGDGRAGGREGGLERREGGREDGGKGGHSPDVAVMMLQDEVAALLGRKEELKDAIASAEQERDAAREKSK